MCVCVRVCECVRAGVRSCARAHMPLRARARASVLMNVIANMEHSLINNN